MQQHYKIKWLQKKDDVIRETRHKLYWRQRYEDLYVSFKELCDRFRTSCQVTKEIDKLRVKVE